MFVLDDIKKIEWIQVEPEPLGGDLAEDLGKIINKFVKFGLNDWWKYKGFNKESKSEYLSLKGPFDRTVRQCVYMAKTIAAAVKFKFYDEKEVGHKLYVARDRYMKLIRSCLYHHIANSTDGWGGCSEHLSAVTELLFVCWLVWDKLNIRDKEYAVNLLNLESERVINQAIEYNYNSDDSQNDGECKTIVNMENANLLYLISVMTESDTTAQDFREKAILTYRSCFASKNHGDMAGYNVGEDMLIHRFDTRSPFATSYIGVGIKAFIFSKIAEQDLPSGACRNFEDIYKAFYGYEIQSDGKRNGLFTVYDKKNRPCGGILYPDGIRGGRVNESALYVMDIFAYILGAGQTIDISSREWAKARMKLIEKTFKHNEKFTFQGCNQYRNVHGEAVCSELTDCYLALFLYLVAKKAENNFVDKFSREEYSENNE